jgi:hypothetical protein
VASKLKKIIIAFTVDPDYLSEDAQEDNLEGFRNLLHNVIVDGLAHAEPKAVYSFPKMIMTDEER